ncbi:alpha/beta fold hydrolase [Paucibacter sp. PLA-PC-4]|uniref:alpha/beta fold hydrolase n=1 Tax=Paucibacter sp. PLA-PC-4 TaxID=2993655 RepID=UPI0022490F54|nr:alpha/beta fold hydrolase [Paucibacter sp. PLA-PC-4]MCX2860496.1 alpha/beta fold hydrolase [Paucibacter sp. PLA-PC-4]
MQQQSKDKPGASPVPPAEAARRWLSEGLEILLYELQQQPRSEDGFDVDVLIVGSGYGGAAAAAELSRCPGQRIVVLERGREYLAGQFPERMADMPGHVRFATPAAATPSGRWEGLFDLRLGPDVSVVLANGLGGGSLINAGVMEPARPEVFTRSPWPQALRQDPEQMRAWYERAGRLLGSLDGAGLPNTIDRLASYAPKRALWLRQLGDAATRRPAITVALDEQPQSPAGLDLNRCIACGDCATGCNHGAKQSLDTNLLLQARQRGVRLISGASVLRLERLEAEGWIVRVNHTDEFLRRRQLEPFALRARRVVLAAGSLGSTEILMRSRAAGLALSDRLGHQFSGNGDVLAAAVQVPQALDAVADEVQAPNSRNIGPTITAMLDVRDEQDFVVQDLAIPGPLRWAWEESFALADCLDGLARPDDSSHGADVEFDDPYTIRPEATARMLPLAIMGLDSAQGQLRLLEPGALGEGLASVHWPELKDDVRVAARHAWLDARLRSQGARLLANPLWRLLPPDLEHLLGGARGPMLTVHPLGGCAMADHAALGVVNQWGQVYRGRAGAVVYDDLVVLDGAIVPSALGINPALTITALALRALEALMRQWGLQGQCLALPKPGPRPVYRQVPADTVQPQLPTMAELRERMSGFVRLPGAPGSGVVCMELTLVFEPLAIRQLLRAGSGRRLKIKPGGESRLRLFEAQLDPDSPGRWMVVKPGSPINGQTGQGKLWMHAERADADALWVAPLASAELLIFHRLPLAARTRRCNAMRAWFLNRGWRDAGQALLERLSQNRAPERAPRPLWQWAREQWRNARALASHGGEVRLMEYRLQLGEAEATPLWAAGLAGLALHGAKRISYTRRGNPWKQLSRMRLESGPFLPVGHDMPAELELDLFYLARQRVPLLRLTQTQDSPSAIRDVGSLMAFIARLMIGIHVWSFRKPDAPPPRVIERLPGEVPGLPLPEIQELAAGRRGEAGLSRQPITSEGATEVQDQTPVMLRLTRYRAAEPGARAVLMLHGYSASGTTFAHHSVQPGPAKLLWDAGYDVWLLDMRTSAGMPTATLPWTFEEAAFNDIPLAVDHVLRATGQLQLDVLAHCMGSVMLHMALLEEREQPFEHFFALRSRLRQSIRRLVISQVTPKMIFSPTNTLRAFMMQYLRPYLPLQHFAFRPEGPQGLMDQLIDRLLASLPYPDEEFDIENPPFPSLRKTPWTATRHRMDLLYGRDFAISNVDQPVFDYIDDHFGPLNMDTVAQAINFARSNEITDWAGASLYLDDMAKSLALLQAFPVLSVHGQDNGLCQSESGELTADLYQHLAPGRYRYRMIAGHGHQDCLIGRHAGTQVFPHIIAFLKED